ncbi:MAG: hypothetical protein KZQ83_20535 [gamma proteobacterium symbiont of Taylorina sp.]|nr:hypothetical protein [gamma proteobacterium symbiont of Taylorina sp.]
MSDNHYNTLESIFTIPDDVSTSDKDELINNLICRIQSTVMTIYGAVDNDIDLPTNSIAECFYGVYDQLEQLKQLIEFEVKENQQ